MVKVVITTVNATGAPVLIGLAPVTLPLTVESDTHNDPSTEDPPTRQTPLFSAFPLPRAPKRVRLTAPVVSIFDCPRLVIETLSTVIARLRVLPASIAAETGSDPREVRTKSTRKLPEPSPPVTFSFSEECDSHPFAFPLLPENLPRPAVTSFATDTPTAAPTTVTDTAAEATILLCASKWKPHGAAVSIDHLTAERLVPNDAATPQVKAAILDKSLGWFEIDFKIIDVSVTHLQKAPAAVPADILTARDLWDQEAPVTVVDTEPVDGKLELEYAKKRGKSCVSPRDPVPKDFGATVVTREKVPARCQRATTLARTEDDEIQAVEKATDTPTRAETLPRTASNPFPTTITLTPAVPGALDVKLPAVGMSNDQPPATATVAAFTSAVFNDKTRSPDATDRLPRPRDAFTISEEDDTQSEDVPADIASGRIMADTPASRIHVVALTVTLVEPVAATLRTHDSAELGGLSIVKTPLQLPVTLLPVTATDSILPSGPEGLTFDMRHESDPHTDVATLELPMRTCWDALVAPK